jgi:hypothetical protein
MEAIIEKLIIPVANNPNSGFSQSAPPTPPNPQPVQKSLGRPLPLPTEPRSSLMSIWVPTLSATGPAFPGRLRRGSGQPPYPPPRRPGRTWPRLSAAPATL